MPLTASLGPPGSGQRSAEVGSSQIRSASGTSLRQTLASRRESRSSRSGDVFHCNTRWIKEGKVTDDDIFPWLRSIQIQGFELTIVGSSPDAVRVCIEAWNAGFKPVLIMMESQDQVDSKATAKVRQLLRKLSWWHGGSGMFTYGPRMIVSEGPRCLVQLDHKGRAIDVSVCTDNGGLHTLAETWQLFMGPAIIVDDVGTVDVEPGRRSSRSLVTGKADQPTPDKPDGLASTNRRTVFLNKMKQERAAVVDPKFWEDRYDPERLSFWAVGYREIAPNLFVGLVQMFVVVAVTRWVKDDYYRLWRALADAVLELPCASALTTLYSGALGLQLRCDRPTVISSCVSVGYWLVNIVPFFLQFNQYFFAEFVGSPLALNYMLATVLLFCKYVKHMEITKPMLLWYGAVAAGTLGPWFGTMAILLTYLVMLGWNPVVASVFLTVAFTGMELQMIKFVLFCYNKFVWEPRRSQPDRVPGDQKSALTTCVIVIHAFTETGRLVSMTCGAVRAEDTTFLYTNAVAVLLGLVINIAGRTGWAGCFLVSHAGPCLKPRLQFLLCPSAIQGLHIDVKYAMGWPRFFFLAGLWLGRGCIHNNWSITLTGHDPSVWCWNGIVLLTAFMAFLGEVVEDWLVYMIVAQCPSPQWECFGSAMVNRFDIPGRDDIYHPCHYLVPQSAFLAPSADTTKTPSLKRATVKDRIARASTKFVQDLAPTLSVSPNFKHVRYISAFQLQHCVGGTIVMIITTMSIGLGNGNLFGFCRPIRLDAFSIVLRNSLLWSKECEAEVSF